MKTTKIEFSANGRSLVLNVKNYSRDEVKYSWLSGSQRKKLEKFFGKIGAYYTSINILNN